VFPIGLAPTAHDEQVARRRSEIVLSAFFSPCHVELVAESSCTRTYQPGALRAEGKYRDDRVVEPAHVCVSMKALSVEVVSVLDHRETFELAPVPSLNGSGDIGKERVGERASAPPPGAEPLFFDGPFVAKQLGAVPGHRISKVLEQLGGLVEPTASDVDPTVVIQ
jgi:hypothetical protein